MKKFALALSLAGIGLAGIAAPALAHHSFAAEFDGAKPIRLVGKITNLASRGAQMLHKHFGGALGAIDADGEALVAWAKSRAEAVADAYEKRDFCRAMVEVRGMADRANQYFDSQAPWGLVKTNPARAQQVLTAFNASAGPYGLRAGLKWWLAGFPLALLYFGMLFRLHRGKVSAAGDGEGY